ncbi:hypothetical protein GW17_00000106 [Ensete ventricosum]|nr:hypothetical protein GW17_00000106 [Ensete ventricosum]
MEGLGLLCRESKAFHWSLVVNLSLVVHHLKHCIKLVLRLILTFIRFVSNDIICFLSSVILYKSRFSTPTCTAHTERYIPVKAVAEELGLGFLGIGFQPKWRLNDIPVMPKVSVFSWFM